MDYAERGTVEKTLDDLIADSGGFGDALDPELGQLASEEGFTPEGRAYFTGVLSGILATVRTFSDGKSAFDREDVEEIRRIAASREAELLGTVTPPEAGGAVAEEAEEEEAEEEE